MLTGYEDLPPTGAVGRDGDGTYLTTDYRGEPVQMASALRRLSVAQIQNGQEATVAQITRLGLSVGISFFFLARPF